MRTTEFVWVILPLLALTAGAQPNSTNKVVRPVSLQEAIVMALEHNLDLKISRLDPEIARLNIRIAYAGETPTRGAGPLGYNGISWDPSFFVEGEPFGPAGRVYDTRPNIMTASRRATLLERAGKASTDATDNLLGSQKDLQNTLSDQAKANRDLVINNSRIRTFNTDLANINDQERLGEITRQEAQLRRTELQTRLADAQAGNAEARATLARAPADIAAAQSGIRAAQLSQSQAASLANTAQTIPLGAEIPHSGILDPTTGRMIFSRNVDVTDTYSTGFRGGLPTGMSYEIALRTARIETSELPDKFYESSAGIYVTQPLLRNSWIDATRALIQVNKKDLKISELGLRQIMCDTVTRVHVAYYDLLFAQENLKVQQKGLELAYELMTENRRRAEVGMLSPLDQRQTESQAALAVASVERARQDFEIAENAFKRLVTDDFAQWQNTILKPSESLISVPEQFNLGESWAKGLQLRPDYNQALTQVERQNIILRFRYNQLFPELNVVGSFAGNGLDVSGYGRSIENISTDNPTYSIGAIFNMPVFNTESRARYKITKLQKEQAILALKKVEQDVLAQIDDAIKRAQTALLTVTATRDARVYAEAAYDAALRRQEAGTSTAFIVLQLQRDLTTARFQEINALASYNKALAQLFFSEGTTLERNKIALQVR